MGDVSLVRSVWTEEQEDKYRERIVTKLWRQERGGAEMRRRVIECWEKEEVGWEVWIVEKSEDFKRGVWIIWK